MASWLRETSETDSGVHTADAVGHDVVPEDLVSEFRAVSRKLAAANNDLSLVFHDLNGHCAFFGDASAAALEGVIPRMRQNYRVILAPHHGTYPLPSGFPATAAPG